MAAKAKASSSGAAAQTAAAPAASSSGAADQAASSWQQRVISSAGRASEPKRLRDWRCDDPAYVSIDSEDGENRNYWTIKQCPIKGCSKNSWSKVRCWSYASAEECLDKLKVHAMASSLHQLDEERADEMTCDVDVIASVELVEETAEERQAYRAHADRVFAEHEAKRARFVEERANRAAAAAEAHFDFVAAAK